MTTRPESQTSYEVECFLCGWWCDIRLSRLGNPYFSCPDCGLRCFVNSPRGKERLGQVAKERDADGMFDFRLPRAQQAASGRQPEPEPEVDGGVGTGDKPEAGGEAKSSPPGELIWLLLVVGVDLLMLRVTKLSLAPRARAETPNGLLAHVPG